MITMLALRIIVIITLVASLKKFLATIMMPAQMIVVIPKPDATILGSLVMIITPVPMILALL
jgi:hypothetical protein